MTSNEPVRSPIPSTPKTVGRIEPDSTNATLDRFSIIIYGLVALAMLSQAGWILWLEYVASP